MENLIIHSTKVTPEILLKTNGDFMIKGRIITDNAITTFEPVFKWLSYFESTRVYFEINLDYLNTSASIHLFSILKQLEGNPNIEDIVVKWYYDIDDEDHLETGEFYEEKLERIKFEYMPVRSEAA